MEKEKKYVISTVYNAECKLVFIDELDVTKYFNECECSYNNIILLLNLWIFVVELCFSN